MNRSPTGAAAPAAILAYGGLRLSAHKQASTARPLRVASAAQHYVLPLDQHAGAPSTPRVRPGDRVLAAQPIAAPGGALSAWLHSPVSGTVSAIEPRPAPHHHGAPTLSIVIANDGREQRVEPRASVSFEQLAARELCQHIGHGGIVGLGGAAFPTDAKLLGSQLEGGPHLLLNGTQCEPYISCDDMLMRERAQDVILGARILLHALDARHCTIALEEDTPQAEQALRAALSRCHDERVRLKVVPSIYPAGGERQLISAVFGVEVPFDALPAGIGVVCHNVGTAAAIAHWIRDGQPLISRIVTVAGDGVHQPCNLEARLGTPITTLIDDCGGYTPRMTRLILGGSMMGSAMPLDTLPVTKSTHCVLAATALDLRSRTQEMPCIRCGRCSQACPALLLPQQLHWSIQAGDQNALARYGLMDCIECGCCDYVCPSQIPLVERFRDAKTLLSRTQAEDQAAVAARTRFETRQARLAQLEAQRRAKLAEKRQRLGGRPQP